MKMVKCDRCGEINEFGNSITVFENATQSSDKIVDVDLCNDCKKQLIKFFKPFDKPAAAE